MLMIMINLLRNVMRLAQISIISIMIVLRISNFLSALCLSTLLASVSEIRSVNPVSFLASLLNSLVNVEIKFFIMLTQIMYNKSHPVSILRISVFVPTQTRAL